MRVELNAKEVYKIGSIRKAVEQELGTKKFKIKNAYQFAGKIYVEVELDKEITLGKYME